MRAWQVLGVTVALAATLVIAFVLFGSQSRHAAANPIGGLTSISAGEGATCAVTIDGGVKCWGALGGGNTLLPADVPGLSNVANVSVGSGFACTLMQSDAVMCWGDNSYGELGNGTARSSPTPIAVPGLESGVAQVSAGFQHSCAVMIDGGVKCWGANDYGQSGSGTTSLQPPGDVVGLSGSAAVVSAGFQHTCAVTTLGAAQCWGRNDYGQLGDGTQVSRLTATGVSGLDTGVVAIAGTLNASCAVMTGGGVKCWGLGYGSTPVDLAGVDDAVGVDAGFSHFCVITSTAGVQCWGANGYGQLGDGLICGSHCLSPVDVSGLSTGVNAIAAGFFHTCALADGGARCWGNNMTGALGSGTASQQTNVPVNVVVQDVKLTPTPTPCPPEGCATPTPQPGLPQTGVDFSISVDANGDGVPECGTGTDQPRECSLAPDSSFQVVLTLNALPVGVPIYGGFDLELEFAGVKARATWTPLWPDCELPLENFSEAFPYPGIAIPHLAVGCSAGFGGPSSDGGPLAAIDFSCSGTGSIAMGHEHDSQGHALEAGIVTTDLQEFWQFHEMQPALTIDCGPLERGDANCSRTTNAIDAELMLQYDAAYLHALAALNRAA